MAAQWSDRLLLKVVNVLAYIFLFGSNIYASALPSWSHGHVQHGSDTYITPAPYAFYVWTVINALFLGFIIFQFFPQGYDLTVEHIGWRFAIVGVLNAVYVHLYAQNQQIPALIVVLFLASAVSYVYWSLRSHPPSDGAQLAFCHLPWSMLHAWSIILIIISLFAAFGKSTDQHAGVWTRIFVAIALAFLACTAWGYAFNSEKGDLAGAIVIAWALLGVFTAHEHPHFIHWFALGAFLVSLAAVLKATYGAYKSRSGAGILIDPERDPLLSS